MTTTAAPPRARPTHWPAVLAVTAGIFVIVTAEILPIGLLTPMAGAFAVSEGTAGLMMTLPGLVAAVAAPVVTVTTARLDRRLMLAVLMAVLAASNAVCAVADDFALVLAARVLVGLVIGGFWSIGAGLAGRLVARRHVAAATATIFSAVPLGSVLGVPAGTLIGDVAGWRTAFVVLGGLTAAILVALLATLPRLPARHVTRLAVLGELLRHRRVRVGLLATVLVVLAHFGTYTYVTPFLAQVTRLDGGTISAVLLVYGAAGLVGNTIAGRTVVAHLRATFTTAAALIAVVTLILPLVGDRTWCAVVLLMVWGLAYGAVPACSLAWIGRDAASPEGATVLFTSAFQATIAAGALAGGALLDATALGPVMRAGGLAAVVVVGVLAVAGGRFSAAGGR